MVPLMVITPTASCVSASSELDDEDVIPIEEASSEVHEVTLNMPSRNRRTTATRATIQPLLFFWGAGAGGMGAA